MARDLEKQTDRMMAFLLVVFISIEFQIFCTASPNQNQVIKHLKMLSQSVDSGLQPSRLRALLVNDVQNILNKDVTIDLSMNMLNALNTIRNITIYLTWIYRHRRRTIVWLK